jgi:ankyrin repeat protein
LDEGDDNQIRDMVSFFETIREFHKSATCSAQFHVCFSSRYYPNITISNGLTLELEGQEGHNQDITSYLESELKIGSSVLARQIRTELQNKSSGIFMWVVLVIGILNKEFDRGRIHRLRERLQDIPSDLNQLFHDILTRDCDNRDDLVLCIQWILFARQPLSPEQLYFAILSGNLYPSLSRWDPSETTLDDIKRFILDASKGLAEITTKRPRVQFIHESVRDFLLKENGLGAIRPDLGSNFCGQSHERLKQCCFIYLTTDISSVLRFNAPIPKASSGDAAILRRKLADGFPFLEYAAQNMLRHADAAQESEIDQESFMQSFELSRKSLSQWIKLSNVFEKFEVRRYTQNASLLYILAEQNLSNLIKVQKTILQCFEAEGERYGPPFFASLVAGSKEAVRAFLESHAAIQPSGSRIHTLCRQQYWDAEVSIGRDFKFSKQRTILSYLAEFGHENLFAFLLETGKFSLENEPKDERSPLWYAVIKGSEVLVKLLLDTGLFDVNILDQDGRTLLSIAVEEGHEAVVELLLERCVNLETEYRGTTPLQLAAAKGHEAIIELLLGKGATLEGASRSWTPLLRAVTGRHQPAVKLLLDNGANVEHESTAGRASLSYAAETGNEALVKLLLESGALLEAADASRRTPVSFAAERGHEAVVKLLLAWGAGLDAADASRRTPLSFAAQEGHEAVVRLLLDRGANMEFADISGRTPLSLATGNLSSATVHALLESGADIESTDASGRTVISWAAGSETYTRSLWQGTPLFPQSEPTEYSSQSTPSRTAANDCSVLRLLLEKGADLEIADNHGRRPLSYAAGGWNGTAEVKALLENSADIEAKDDSGRTALSWAAWSGNKDAVRLLLENGANPRSKDKSGRTPQMWAEEVGSIEVADLLRNSLRSPTKRHGKSAVHSSLSPTG